MQNIILILLLLLSTKADGQKQIFPSAVAQLGNFSNPVSLSLGQDNTVYVSDVSTSSVYVFSFSGKHIATFGGRGWGNYEFDSPVDIHSSFLLELFVVDRNNRRVQQYDRMRNFVQSYSAETINPKQEHFYPRAVSVSRLGNIFILDSDQNRILKLNSRQSIERAFGTFQDGIGKLTNPIDIVCTATDEVVVLDGSRLVVFDNFGNFVRELKLNSDEQWLSISSYFNGILVTGAKSIVFVTLNGEKIFEIKSNNIISETSVKEFRDAVLTEQKLLILTPNTILSFEKPLQ